MNFKINKSKSIYNINLQKKKGKSIHNIYEESDNDNNIEYKRKKEIERIKKIREVDPTYLIELQIETN